MKKHVKIILLGAAVLMAAGSLVYYIAAPLRVHMTQVEPKAAQLTFTEQGEVTGGRVFGVYPLVQGRLLELLAEEGQRVRAGDTLCVIDAEPYRSRADQSRSLIKSYRAQLDLAQSQSASLARTVEESLRLQELLIEGSQNDKARADRELERAEFLYEEGSIAKIELEAARDAARRSGLELEAARRKLDLIAAEEAQGDTGDYYRALIEMEQAALAQIEREISHCVVTAPADGVVTALPAQQTNYISGTLPVAELAADRDMRIETSVATKDICSLSEGDTVLLTFKRREGDLEFKGEITKIHENADIALSALGLEERRVKVEIAPDLSQLVDTPLGVGYDVEVTFILYSEENQLAVPKTALFKDADRDMVWLLRRGRAEATEVITGMELRTETVILSGVEAGDFVITDANNADLKDRARVRQP